MGGYAFGRAVARRRVGSDRDEIHLAMFVMAYVAMAATAWPHRFLSLFALYLAHGTVLMALMAVVGACMLALFRSGRHPLRFVRLFFAERIVRSASILLLFMAGLAAFTTYKIAIPEIVPFYADDYLAAFGRLFNENGLWKTTHLLIPAWLGVILVFCYGKIWLVYWLGVVIFAALSSDEERSFRYLLALALTVVICGTFLATALSSVGPIYYDHFYGGSRYHDLYDVLNANTTTAAVLGDAGYLLSAFENHRPEFASGISAAPSMHVAIALLSALFLTSCNRWLGLAGWLYAALIMVGSVYTGWHYAMDGGISIAAVSLIWWCAGRVVAADTDDAAELVAAQNQPAA